MDHPTVQAISKAFGPIEGIVGFPFFARFKTTLDYKARTMTFVPSGYDPPDVMKSMMAALTAISGDEPLVLSTSATWGLTVDKKEKDEEAGVTVTRLLAGGPAAKAGLKEGDRLLTLDGRWTDSVADTIRAASAIKPGTPTVAVVQRDGKELQLTIKPISGQ
jgi:predicted metalloprotease with PDZ domain